MASSSPHPADRHVNWPGLRFPPINLWVMPAWQKAAKHAGLTRHAPAMDQGALQQHLARLLDLRRGSPAPQEAYHA